MGILRARVNVLTALCSTTVTARCPGSGLGTLRARMHLMMAVSRPGSGAGTLRARMHCTLAVSRPGSGASTLRARMHLMLAVSRPGSGLGTLQTRVHAQALLCCNTATLTPLSGSLRSHANCRHRLIAAGLLMLHAFGTVPKSHAKAVQHLSTASPGYRLTCTRVCLSYSQG